MRRKNLDLDAIRRLRADGLTVRQIAKSLGVSGSSIQRRAKENGISLALPVMTPAQRLAKARKRKNEKYRSDPVFRERCKARAKKNRDYASIAIQDAVWHTKHPTAKPGYDRNYRVISKAIGYNPLILRGDMVTTSVVEGQWRVIAQYVVDGEAVCDLDDGKTIMREWPMRSLKLMK